MDVKQYFNPVDFSTFAEKIQEIWKYSLGQTIEKSTSKLTEINIKKVEVVIFGVPCYDGSWEENNSKSTDKIRQELFSLAHLTNKINIIDLGDLKPSISAKGNYLAIRDLVEYFSELKIVTLVLGGSSDLSIGICEAYKNEQFFTLSSIDSHLDVKKGKEIISSSNYLSYIFQKIPSLFQFNLLGFQRHLVAPELFSKTNGFGEHISLGEIHEDLEKAEPVFRNSNVVIFDMQVIKYAEISGSEFRNPNGLSSDEICQLAKYAGLSNKLKLFGLFETNIKKDSFGITFKLAAQIVWYFFEGLSNRTDDLETMNENILTYKVEVDEMEKPIKFIYNKGDERWWIEIQSLTNEKNLVACTENEYLQATKNEIPDLWLNYIQKIDNFSK